MSKLGKLVKKAIDKSTFQKSREKGRKARAADALAGEDIPLMMPDNEELRRAHRKKVAGRKGGRASTILTGPGDRLGP